MSEATEAPKGKKKTDEELDLDSVMQTQKDRLTKQRDALVAERDKLDEQIGKVDTHLAKIDAWFNPPATREPEAKAPRKPRGPSTKPRAPRQSGVRDNVLAEIAKHKDGIKRAELLTAMGATEKNAQQSISNAVAALKKDGKITGDQGLYKAV